MASEQQEQQTKQVLARTTAQKRRSSLNSNVGLRSAPVSSTSIETKTTVTQSQAESIHSSPKKDKKEEDATPNKSPIQQQQQYSSPKQVEKYEYIEEKDETPPSKMFNPQQSSSEPSSSKTRNNSLTNNPVQNQHINDEEEGRPRRRQSDGLDHVSSFPIGNHNNNNEEDDDYSDKRDYRPRRSSLTTSNGHRQSMDSKNYEMRPRRVPNDDDHNYDGESEHSRRLSQEEEEGEFYENSRRTRPRRASQGSQASSSNGNSKPFARPRRQSRSKHSNEQSSSAPSKTDVNNNNANLLTVSMVKSNSNLVVTNEKKDESSKASCATRMSQCYRTSPFCPSATRALELFAISLDGLAVVFFALSMVIPWVTSVAPCSNCPQEFSSSSFLTDRGLRATFGLFSAGSLSNPQFLPVSDYFNAINTTLSLTWAQNYSQYYFPPQANIFWQDLSSNQVCLPDTPGYLTWGLPFGMCPYSVPGPAMGSQAFGILAAIFAGFSMFTMIAARRGRSGFAQCSTLCSVLSAGFGLGSVLYFSLWSYNREHIGLGRGTIPIPAVSRSGEFSQTMIVPINANFGWDAGYYLGIFSIAFECISTLISWIAGTEKCLWTPDSDVIYGPDSWIYGANTYNDPGANINQSNSLVQVRRRPTLQELGQQPTHQTRRDVAIV